MVGSVLRVKCSQEDFYWVDRRIFIFQPTLAICTLKLGADLLAVRDAGWACCSSSKAPRVFVWVMGVDSFECARTRRTISSFVWRHATLQAGTERDDLGLGISMIEIPAFSYSRVLFPIRTPYRRSCWAVPVCGRCKKRCSIVAAVTGDFLSDEKLDLRILFAVKSSGRFLSV